MNKALFIISIQHELTMAIGNELDLNAMLKVFLKVCFNRLNLTSAHIYTYTNDNGSSIHLTTQQSAPHQHLLSLPKRNKGHPWSNDVILASFIEALDKQQQNHVLKCDNEQYLFGFIIPQHGLLVFETHYAIEEPIQKALTPILQKLATSCYTSIVHDSLVQEIYSRKDAEEKLTLAASVFTHARESIIITDAASMILDVNDTFSHITGYSREEAIGKSPSILQSGRQPPEFYTDMWQVLIKDGSWSGEIWNRRKNGEVYAEMKIISAVKDKSGVTTHYVALCSDITPMKKHAAQLEHIAHYDVLTNLPNRSLLADRLSLSMVQSQRHDNSLAVVFLDLGGFKDINDTHGHNVGDGLLIVVSQRMKEALREGDTLARIGGDEFVAVLVDLAKIEDCEPVLERLLLAASETIAVGGAELHVSTSIGVTIYPQDSVDADQLMRHADQAMYVAKQAGKKSLSFI